MDPMARNSTESFRVVCLLSSAGGLAPLKAFFENVPPGTGLAFLVLHLPYPGHPWIPPESLHRCARIPVRLARRGDLVLPNQALVMASGMALTMVEGQLRVTREETSTADLPGDHLFESAAALLGERVVGVVLSGSALDGAAGLRAIQARGGFTLAQDPATALHATMPQFALDEGVVDGVCAAEHLPRRILQETNAQSSGEEQQAFREPWRPVDENLRFRNRELAQNGVDLNESNSDLQNMMASTEIATLFLSEDLRITRFTPAAIELFGLVEGDRGRPLNDLAPRFSGVDLPAIARKVMSTGVMVEDQATTDDGRKWFLVRLIPYRALDQIGRGVAVTFIDCTEIRLAQQRALDSEAMFRNLFKNMVNGLAHCRMRFEGDSPVDFLCLNVNQAFEALTGLQNMAGRWVSEVLPGFREEHPQVLDFLGQVARTGRSGRLESYLPALHGWFDISAYSPQKDEVVAVFDHITIRKQAEMATAHLAAIVECSDDAIISKSLEGIITSWNAAASRMFGYLPEEIIGRPITTLIPPERQAEEPEIIRRVLNGEKIEHLKTVRRRKDGTHLDVSLTISPIKGTEGTIIGISKVVRDITQSMRIEEEIRASRAMFIAAISSMTDPLFIADATGHIIEFNDAFALFFRFNSKEDCAESVDELASLLEVSRPTGESVPSDQWAVARALRGETATGVVYHIRRKDIDETWVGSFNFAPIRDHKADIVGAVVLTYDITERLRLESERKRFEAEFQQSQKMESMGVLAGGVAHDMNNVLGAILTIASMHLATESRESHNYRAFEIIRDAATRGGDMVKRLLAFARQGPLVRERLDVNALVLEEGRLLERTTLARLRIELDLAPDLHSIHGDASALTHAIMNLCVNAVDAMPEGGTLTIRTHNVDADQVEIVVEDTGCGMTREVLDRALDPFYTTKEVGKGTGLGLPLVFRMVKDHGGQLKIESAAGQGTRVKLLFPASLTTELATANSAQVSIDPPPIPLHVLLIDDDELIRESVGMLVEALGHAIAFSSSGEEALKLIEDGHNPDVIILDMNMPGWGGKGTLPRLRALRADVPVLLATGRADQEALDLVAAFPFVTLLAKPFGIAELKRNLYKVSRKSSGGDCPSRKAERLLPVSQNRSVPGSGLITTEAPSGLAPSSDLLPFDEAL